MRTVKSIIFYSVILVMFYLGINEPNIIGIAVSEKGQPAIAVKHPLFCTQVIYIYSDNDIPNKKIYLHFRGRMEITEEENFICIYYDSLKYSYSFDGQYISCTATDKSDVKSLLEYETDNIIYRYDKNFFGVEKIIKRTDGGEKIIYKGSDMYAYKVILNLAVWCIVIICCNKIQKGNKNERREMISG